MLVWKQEELQIKNILQFDHIKHSSLADKFVKDEHLSLPSSYKGKIILERRDSKNDEQRLEDAHNLFAYLYGTINCKTFEFVAKIFRDFINKEEGNKEVFKEGI